MLLDKFRRLPVDVQKSIVESLRGPESIIDLSDREAFDRWLRYEGIIGWTDRILTVVSVLFRKD